MIYAMEKSIESLSKPKWWRTIAVGSLALSLLVGSCSAKHQSPESAPETSTSASATPGGLTYEELASEIGNGKPVWIAPVAYPENADGGNGGIVVRPVVEVDGDPTCQKPGESRQVGSAQVEYYRQAPCALRPPCPSTLQGNSPSLSFDVVLITTSTSPL